MGCFSSRFDQRAKAYSSDYNTTMLAFIGGEAGKPYDAFPHDRCAWLIEKSKEIADSCPVEINETQITEAYKKARVALENIHKDWVKKFGGDKADGKEGLIGGRYKGGDATKQLGEANAWLDEQTGIEAVPKSADPPAEKEAEGEKKDDEAKDPPADEEGGEEEFSGGEDEEKKEDAGEGMKEAESPHKYDDDATDYKGFANAHMALLRCMIKYPVVGEIVKQEVIQVEMNHEKAKVGEYTGIAGILGCHCLRTQADDCEFFLSGLVSKDDTEALKAIATGTEAMKHIHFPFLNFGWKTKDEALAALAVDNKDVKNLNSYDKVVFKVTGAKSMNAVSCRQVAHKIDGSINAAGVEENGVTTYEVTAEPMDKEKTMKAWEDEVKAKAAAAASKGDAKPEEKKEEEGEKKDNDEKPAEDPPAGGDE